MLELTGAILVGISVAIYGSSVWLFMTVGRGTPLPFAPPQQFVTLGPYRRTRNPMALSVVALLAGLSLLFGSLLGLAGTALAALVLHIYITRREEPLLVERFGEPYVTYREAVPRWVLGPSSPRRAAA